MFPHAEREVTLLWQGWLRLVTASLQSMVA
jgi:hypothetical protein